MAANSELKPYFAEAASWDTDRVVQAARLTRNAWVVAAGAGVCAVVSTAALFALMPLKRVEPFVIRVDNTTGIVDVVPTYEGTTEVSPLVTRYFLNHYVTICERFNFATAESDYQECGAFHGTQRNQEWSAAWDRSNPQSPLNVHKDGSTVSAHVSDISFFKRANGTEDLALVRYATTRRMAGAMDDQRSYWIATVQYAYGKPPSDPKVRRWNPLGFKIIEFRREPEVQAPSTATESASRASSSERS